MEDLERIEERLDNISSVKPILAALRMIALGSWQAALKRQGSVQAYGAQLLDILPTLLPHLRVRTQYPKPSLEKTIIGSPQKNADGSQRRLLLLVGSERGLCGRFNTAVCDFAQDYLQTSPASEVHLLGRRLQRSWTQQKRPFAWAGSMPFTAIPSYEMAHELTTRWLTRYEAYAIDAVHVIYTRYRRAGLYEPHVWRMLPPQLPSLPVSGAARKWPPPIIETDPLALYTQVVQQWAASALFGVLLESAASEHAARYQLMESATQNAERLVDELTDLVQVARQQAITREMQELAAAAGLIGATE